MSSSGNCFSADETDSGTDNSRISQDASKIMANSRVYDTPKS